jgi:CubicO group peptidase (beta-lactamase class C family)
MRRLGITTAAAMLIEATASVAAPVPVSTQIKAEQLVRPYVDTGNFSGVILATRAGKPVLAKAYGFADQVKRIPNTMRTRFHVASMSMQYTSAAALRLVMAKKLSLDTPVSKYVADFPNGKSITVRHLLTQTSGIRDINGLPDYDAILQKHQTSATLVEKVRLLPPDRDPGTRGGEEHSAYNLLALIIERETNLPFAAAMQRLVFQPLRMTDSGIDDDSTRARINAAVGHVPVGVRGIDVADKIHWSAKTGNASAFTTARDQYRFVRGMIDSNFLAPELRSAVFDLSQRIGYGWFKTNSTRFGEPVYSMNGRAPGFGSAMVYVPREKVFVAALGNLYSSFPADMANELTAVLLQRPYQQLQLKTSTDEASLKGLPARFRFGDDFYQKNAVVGVVARNGESFVEWPKGDPSPLIPTGTDHYVDRAYGVPVEVIRNADGQASALKYDRFTGPVERPQ